MKKLSLVLLAALSFAGCQTAPATDKTAAAVASLQVATSVGATLSLSKNPKYLPAARLLVAGLDQALAGSIPINADVIANFVGLVGTKTGLKPEEVALFASLANTVYEAYLSAYQPKIVLSSDPNAQRYIKAFRDGLATAIASTPAA